MRYMARLGLTDADIKVAIQALEVEGTRTYRFQHSLRLGSGSFSTISAVLQRHREERDRSARSWTFCFRSCNVVRGLRDMPRSSSAIYLL
jgi:hypothetical protein